MQATGIVLYCDILGYRAFLSHNENITPAVEGVINILESASEESRRKTLELVKSLKDFAFLTEQRQSMVFADTIILTMRFDPKDDDLHHAVRWVYLLTEAMILHDHMFRHGLPIRGAITVGSYFLSTSCFAGKPIVEAHDEANDLQLSAIAVTPKAFSAFLRATKMGKDLQLYEWLQRIVHPYKTPCKSGKTAEKRLLLVASGIVGQVEAADNTALSAILTSFSQHEKHLDIRAEEKAANTLEFLKYLAHKG